MKKKYKILKLNDKELKVLKCLLMQKLIDTRVEQNKIEEKRKLTIEEELIYKKNYNDYQNLLRIIGYIER